HGRHRDLADHAARGLVAGQRRPDEAELDHGIADALADRFKPVEELLRFRGVRYRPAPDTGTSVRWPDPAAAVRSLCLRAHSPIRPPDPPRPRIIGVCEDGGKPGWPPEAADQSVGRRGSRTSNRAP